MASVLNASEVYGFAVRIEESGEKFYRGRAASAPGPVAQVFNLLASDEAQHRQVFAALAKETAEYQAPESYPGEYFSYLRAYADQVLFSDAAAASLPAGAETRAVLDFAIGRELASMTYYTEISRLVPEGQRAKIDAIIEQERLHFARLSNLKAQL